MENWKKIIIRAVGFGAGFAVAAGILVGVAVWWSSRPVKPKPRNMKAITATFDTLDTEGDANTFEFIYTLENNTDDDYRVSDESEIHLAGVLKDEHSFTFNNDKFLTADYPIYIPSRNLLKLVPVFG
jgi:hypothetical protein